MKPFKLFALITLSIFLFGCECGENEVSGTIPPYTDEYEISIGNRDETTCKLEKIRITFDQRIDRLTLIAPGGCEFKYPSRWGPVTHRGNVFIYGLYNTYTAENVEHTATSSTGPRFTYTNCPLDEGEHHGVWTLKVEGSSSLSNDYTVFFEY